MLLWQQCYVGIKFIRLKQLVYQHLHFLKISKVNIKCGPHNGIPGTHLIDLRKMKRWVTHELGVNSWTGSQPTNWEFSGLTTNPLLLKKGIVTRRPELSKKQRYWARSHPFQVLPILKVWEISLSKNFQNLIPKVVSQRVSDGKYVQELLSKGIIISAEP